MKDVVRIIFVGHWLDVFRDGRYVQRISASAPLLMRLHTSQKSAIPRLPDAWRVIGLNVVAHAALLSRRFRASRPLGLRAFSQNFTWCLASSQRGKVAPQWGHLGVKYLTMSSSFCRTNSAPAAAAARMACRRGLKKSRSPRDLHACFSRARQRPMPRTRVAIASSWELRSGSRYKNFH